MVEVLKSKPRIGSRFLYVSIRSRGKVLFDGEAASVTSFNDLGEFDVLPQHANFVTLIRDSIILSKGEALEKKIDIESGVMNVAEGNVDVYLGL